MDRKVIIAFVAAAALVGGIAGMSSSAEARHYHRNRHDDGLPLSFFAFPGYSFGSPHYYYDDYRDCGYRRVLVRKWNKAHTKRIKVYRKRWVCY